MEKLSASKIYRESNPDQPFAQWIEVQKLNYNEKKKNGVIGDIDFDSYLNMQHQFYFNSDGFVETSKRYLKGIFGKIAEKQDPTLIEDEGYDQYGDKNKPEKNYKPIFGLKPIVFYSVSTVALLVLGYGIYSIVKSSKKEKDGKK